MDLGVRLVIQGIEVSLEWIKILKVRTWRKPGEKQKHELTLFATSSNSNCKKKHQFYY